MNTSKDFFTHNPLWHEQIGKIYALLERVKISEERSKDVLHLMLSAIEDSMLQYIDVIRQLKEKGKMVRMGSRKTGYWKIIQ
jgi:hypothetical protein